MSDPPDSPTATRRLDRAAFDRAYDRVVIGNDFHEAADYYHRYRGRYRRTFEYVASLPLPRPARVLEVGGGQTLLLMHAVFGDTGTLADVNDDHAGAIAIADGAIDFTPCDLQHDDPQPDEPYDLVLLCEVIEHLTVPPYIVLEKVARWVKPGGCLLITTPNFYRLRNGLRMLLGLPLFCNFFYPERGQAIGHPLEYSAAHLRFQLERAGLEVDRIDITQLTWKGATTAADLARVATAPLLWLRRSWRDNLVAIARRPAE